MAIAFVTKHDYICNVKDRVRKLLLDEGLTSGAFADEIGVQRSSLSHILNGRNKPSLDFVIKTKNRFPALNLSWFLMGDGDMYLAESQASRDDISASISSPSIFNSLPDDLKDEMGSKVHEILDIPDISTNTKASQVDQIVIFFSDQSFRSYKPKS